MRHLRHLALALCATLLCATALASPAGAAPTPPTVGLSAAAPLTELVAGTDVTIDVSYGTTVVASSELSYLICDTDQQTDCDAEVPVAGVTFAVPSGQSGRYLFGVMHTFDGGHVELGRYVSAPAGPLAGMGTFRLSDSGPVPGDVISVVAQEFYPEPTGVSPTWQRCDASGLSCVGVVASTTYTVTNDDAGHTLRANVDYTHVLAAGPLPTPASSVVPFDYSAMGVEWSGTTPAAPTPGDDVDFVGTAGYDQGNVELVAALGSSASTDGQTGGIWSCPTASFDLTCVSLSVTAGADLSAGQYTVTQADEGSYLVGRLDLPDLGGGFGGTTLMTEFREVIPFVPTIGTFGLNNFSPAIGDTLSVQNLGWDPDPDISGYLWHSCTGPTSCEDVGTSATYTVTSAEAGRYLYATMTFTQYGSSSSFESTGASDPVPGVVGTYELSDTTPQIGDVVSAAAVGWDPAPVVGGVKWYSCTDITACDMVSQALTYTVASSDGGRMLQFEAVYQQAGSPGGYSYTALSDTVPPAGTFELSNTSPVLGDVLSVNPTDFVPAADFDGADTVWSRCIPGDSCTQISTGETYTVGMDDLGYAIHAEVDYTQGASPVTTGYTDDSDLVGFDTQNWSVAIGSSPVTVGDDLDITLSPRVLVAIDAGAASINRASFDASASTQMWACDTSTFSSTDASCHLRVSQSITAQPSYTAAADDAGLYLFSVVNYPDIGAPFPAAQTVVSNALGPVDLPQPPLTGPAPTTTGSTRVGDTLSAAHGPWTGTGPLVYTWTWARCTPVDLDCDAIAGASSDTYTLTVADTGYVVQATLHISDSYSGTEDSSAAPSATVVAAPAGSLSAGVRSVGDTIIVSGTGFAPFTEVTVTLYSDPVVLGTVTTDSLGAFTQSFAIPAATAAGAHHIVLTGVDGNGNAAEVSMQLTLTEARVVDPPGGSTTPGAAGGSSRGGGTGAAAVPNALALTGSNALALLVSGIFAMVAGAMFLALSTRARRRL